MDRAAEIAENNRFRAEMKRQVNDPTPEEIAELEAYQNANPELFAPSEPNSPMPSAKTE